MKRQNRLLRILYGWHRLCPVVLFALVGCTDQPTDRTARAVEAEGWITPPLVESVERGPRGLTIRGRAMPSGRVAFSGVGDRTYAVGADKEGHFDLSILAPSAPALVRIESRQGQEATPAPHRLLISNDPKGPVALVAPGIPSRRLDRVGPLDSIDSDGVLVTASGRAVPHSEVEIVWGARSPILAKVDAAGRWAVVLSDAGVEPARVSVAGRSYLYPGLAPGAEDQILEPFGQGWRSIWIVSPGAAQASWYPAGD